MARWRRRRPRERKPGRVLIEHADDGRSSELVFSEWYEDHHQASVRLEPDSRDVTFRVEWSGEGTAVPLEWQPKSAIVVVNDVEQRIEVTDESAASDGRDDQDADPRRDAR